MPGTLDQCELREILDFAVDSACSAGAFTLGYFNAGTGYELKADNTPVTAADRGAEERLRRRIEQAFPTHGIVGEEFGEKAGASPARWILDPIDGTLSFISGVPLYSVLVGFEWAGEMLAGVIHLPALNETIYAARGLGCRWNGRSARVSAISDLAQARLVATSTKLMRAQGRADAFERLAAACGIDRGWSDAYGYALLATGRAEIVVDPLMCIWDTAALVPVVTEAGGTVTDWLGRRTHTAPDVLATNGHLLTAALAVLSTVP
ncbi:MAG: inositol monophosphatase family protein [Planctomycetota bacterium]